MSDGSLSQDEIDALLFQGGAGGSSSEPEPAPAASVGDDDINALSDLLEKVTGGMGSTLSGMMGSAVSVDLASVSAFNKDSLMGLLPDETVEIKLDYTGAASGDHLYLMNKEDSVKIAGPMSGQEDISLEGMALAALGEAASQLAGNGLTTMQRETGLNIEPSAPEAQLIPKVMLRLPEGEFLQAEFNLTLEDGSVLTLKEIFDSSLVEAIAGAAAPAEPEPAMNMGQQGIPGGMPGMPGGMPGMPQQQMGMPQQQMGMPQQQMGMPQQQMGMPQQQMGMPQQQMGMPQQQMGMPQQQMGMPQQQMGMPGMGMQQMGMPGYYNPPGMQGVQYPDLSPVDTSGVDSRNIGLLMDVSMELTVELGRTKWQIKDILGIGEGTIIELDKLAGEPVDILVNHNMIARGEVVVIDENFGVRVTEIVSTGEHSKDK